MKNILVPTDFSETAMGAYLFAQELALYLDGSIKVVNVAHPQLNTDYPYIANTFDEMVSVHGKKLQEFVISGQNREISEVLTKTEVSNEVIGGFAAEEIVRLSGSAEVDLIVMGTTGKGGVLDKLLGSISTIVAQKAHCPVLLIPKGTEFKDFDNILYASDFESSDNQLLEEIADLANLFEAKVHLVHVQPDQTKPDFELEELVLEQIFKEKAPKAEIKYVTVWDRDIWHGLNVYARDHGIDMMVMVKPQRNFWDSLLHRSVTKKMITKPSMPILVMPMEE